MDFDIDPSVLECLNPQEMHPNQQQHMQMNMTMNMKTEASTSSTSHMTSASAMLTPFDTSPESVLGYSPPTFEANHKNQVQHMSQTPVSLAATPVEMGPSSSTKASPNRTHPSLFQNNVHQQRTNNNNNANNHDRGYTFPAENDTSFQFSLEPLVIEGFTSSVPSSFQETFLDSEFGGMGGSSAGHRSAGASVASTATGHTSPPARKKSFHKSTSFNQALSSVSETPFDDFLEGSGSMPANVSLGMSSSIAGPRTSRIFAQPHSSPHSRNTSISQANSFSFQHQLRNPTSFDLFEDYDELMAKSALATPLLSPSAASPVGSYTGSGHDFNFGSGGHWSGPNSAANSSVNLKQLARARSTNSNKTTNDATTTSTNSTVDQPTLPIKRPLGQSKDAQPSSFPSSTIQKRSSTNLSASADTSSSSQTNQECTNCHTKTTPLWRRNPQGEPLCNACGLFLKLHGTTRPLSLKTDVIRKRNRLSNQQNASNSASSSTQNSPKVVSGGFDSPGSNMHGFQANSMSFGGSPGYSISAGSHFSNGINAHGSPAIAIAPKPPVEIAPKHVPIAPKPASIGRRSTLSSLPYGRPARGNAAVTVVTATAEAQRHGPGSSPSQWNSWR